MTKGPLNGVPWSLLFFLVNQNNEEYSQWITYIFFLMGIRPSYKVLEPHTHTQSHTHTVTHTHTHRAVIGAKLDYSTIYVVVWMLGTLVLNMPWTELNEK